MTHLPHTPLKIPLPQGADPVRSVLEDLERLSQSLGAWMADPQAADAQAALQEAERHPTRAGDDLWERLEGLDPQQKAPPLLVLLSVWAATQRHLLAAHTVALRQGPGALTGESQARVLGREPQLDPASPHYDPAKLRERVFVRSAELVIKPAGSSAGELFEQALHLARRLAAEFGLPEAQTLFTGLIGPEQRRLTPGLNRRLEASLESNLLWALDSHDLFLQQHLGNSIFAGSAETAYRPGDHWDIIDRGRRSRLKPSGLGDRPDLGAVHDLLLLAEQQSEIVAVHAAVLAGGLEGVSPQGRRRFLGQEPALDPRTEQFDAALFRARLFERSAALAQDLGAGAWTPQRFAAAKDQARALGRAEGLPEAEDPDFLAHLAGPAASS